MEVKLYQFVKFPKSDIFFKFLTFGLFGFLFWHFAKEMLIVRPNGWYVGQVNLYGDLVYHLALINKFLVSGTPIIDNPIFAQDRVNYPILPDYITALISTFTGVDFALFITTLVVGILSVFCARLFIRTFVKDERVVFIALLMFFFSGGLGFMIFINDLLANNKPLLGFLISIPREYTDLKDQGYWWINSYLAYFLPQRSFLFAFPVTLTIMSLLHLGWKKQKTFFYVLAGILAGILPFLQAHSLFLLFMLCLYYLPLDLITAKNRSQHLIKWMVFGFITAALALPLFNLISSIENPLSFIKVDIGWTNKGENLLWFWFKNLGIFLPLLVASLIWLFRQKKLFLLYLPFLIIFLICNIYIFQPWEFDNSKLMVYWFFASCVVVAYFLEEQLLSENIYKKTVAIILIFFTILAGGIDIFRTFTPAGVYQIYSKDDLEVAKAIKTLTPKNSVFVTASNHNNPIPTLTGRSTIIGFHGWIWSHGIDYTKRAADVNQIYLGEKSAEALIRQYKVNYLAVGPQERTNFVVNEPYFSTFPNTNIYNDWTIYDVSNLWSNSNR